MSEDIVSKSTALDSNQNFELISDEEKLKYKNVTKILDIPVQLSLEVGSTKLSIEEVLTLAQGSVIQLNRKAGELLDVKVNGILIARGEVVESEGKYGIRVINVISPSERFESLT